MLQGGADFGEVNCAAEFLSIRTEFIKQAMSLTGNEVQSGFDKNKREWVL